MKTYILIQGLLALIAAALLSGCAGSTGWRVEFGISPVKQLDNRAGLTQEVEQPVKGARY